MFRFPLDEVNSSCGFEVDDGVEAGTDLFVDQGEDLGIFSYGDGSGVGCGVFAGVGDGREEATERVEFGLVFGAHGVFEVGAGWRELVGEWREGEDGEIPQLEKQRGRVGCAHTSPGGRQSQPLGAAEE